MKKNKIFLSILVITISFMFFACNRVALYQELSEEDANEMMVLLGDNGLKATKKKEVRQNEVYWSIIVAESEMASARSLLMKHNLPRKKELGLTGVYKDKGLIPTPDEQKARFLLAIKGEIINSLEKIPGVVDVDVVLNVPTNDEFASAEEKMQKRPTASAIVKLQPSPTGEQALTEAKIQQFVANAVEAMNPRDVTVVISYISSLGKRTSKPGDVKTIAPLVTLPENEKIISPMSEELVGLRLDADSKDRLKVYLLVFFLILIILSTGLIISIVQASRTRRKLAELESGIGDHPAIEGYVTDEGPPQIGGPGMPPSL